MGYDFDVTLDHRYNYSLKWEQPEGRNDVIGMETADLDFTCPPCIKEATKSVWEENTFNYRKKPPTYFQAVLDWYEREYGLRMEKSWLSNVPTTVGAVYIALLIFAGKGKGVIMQAPHFAPLKRAIDGAGCKLITNPMIFKDGRYELDLKDFEKKVKLHRPAVYLMVNPQNPTGRVLNKAELEALADICERNHVLIVSDEVHSLILYDGSRHIPILAVSEAARKTSIQISSLSKAFNIMSLPHAIISIADPDIRKKWKEELLPYSFGYASNPYCVEAVTSIMKGEADEWLKQMTDYLKDSRDKLMAFIKESHFPIEPIKPEAGYLLWIDCRKWGQDPHELAKLFLNGAGIKLNNGEEFGDEGEGFVRLNFAVTKENLDTAMKRMEQMFSRGM